MDIQQLAQRLEKLFEQNKKQKVQISELREQLNQKDKEIEHLWHKVAEIQTKYDNLLSAKSIARDSAEAKMSQQRLSRLVRKIDRCIALLNKTEIEEQQ